MKDPSLLDRLKHGLFGWESWRLPDAERLDVVRDHSRVSGTEPLFLPESFRGLTSGRSRLDRPGRNGVSSGTPMQLGDGVRNVWVGKQELGQRRKVGFPRPVLGTYQPRGWPVPSFDKHLIVQERDGTVHEAIYWDLNGWANARKWGRWLDGVLIDGEPVTATGFPAHVGVWTPWSDERPHVCNAVVPDYVGADGLLTVGPIAGSKIALRASSPSHLAMVALGGACADLANALVVHGARVLDRSGYVDAPHEELGTVPNKFSIHIQTGRQWADTNIHLFDVALSDFVQVTSTK